MSTVFVVDGRSLARNEVLTFARYRFLLGLVANLLVGGKLISLHNSGLNSTTIHML